MKAAKVFVLPSSNGVYVTDYIMF